MRIARLDLARYGRFTDLTLDLPGRETDFHLLVGPNEAGKSTLRSAILDLLFGIETRSPYNFRHAYPDMRLGASIENGEGAALDFIRVKARTRTLRTPDDEVLPDTALLPFLGSVERGFFEQMFGLDHQRLVAGGRDILSAANDVGQILFQSAAGIASFGAVREALEEEAACLWAKRRAGDREYYIAADEFAQAQEILKQFTVRTRDWVSARDEVERLQQEAAETRARYEALAQRRSRLERVRRVAPVLTGLREREAALETLGPFRRLAADAARQLDEAERVMALAAQARQLHETRAAELAEAVARINTDTGLLARDRDIEALAAQRHQVRNHPADVAKRQEEARAHWKTLEGLARELGWPAEAEDALAARIPSQVIRSAAGALVRRHDTLVQAVANAKEAQAVKRGEVTELDQALARLPATELPPELVAALDAARALGDVAAQERRLAGQVERAERESTDARAALGPWQADLDRLRRLHLPGNDELNALREDRLRLRTDAEGLTQRIHEERAAIADLDLEITQYQAAHHPVSLADLAAARLARDGLWQEIRSGTASLAEAAAPYEGLVGEADALADRRHDKAQEAATLQSKLDGRERRARQLALYESRAEENSQRQGQWAAAWEARAVALGLPGMTLDQMNSWCTARDKVL
ncbi:AAA family ATPase, partial [Thioalkalicoccus limnaeus]